MATRARKLDKSVHSGGQSAFCELMVKARKAAGWTQRELADRLHKPQSFVAKDEGGERRIDVVEFLTVCQAIGVVRQSSVQKQCRKRRLKRSADPPPKSGSKRELGRRSIFVLAFRSPVPRLSCAFIQSADRHPA